MNATTLDELTTDELGQLLRARVFPSTKCSDCGTVVVSIIAYGNQWAAQCSECDRSVPASYVVFRTADDLNLFGVDDIRVSEDRLH
jgi:hypothetical protein